MLSALTLGQKGEQCLWTLILTSEYNVSSNCSLGGCSLEKLQILGSKAWADIFGVIFNNRAAVLEALITRGDGRENGKDAIVLFTIIRGSTVVTVSKWIGGDWNIRIMAVFTLTRYAQNCHPRYLLVITG